MILKGNLTTLPDILSGIGSQVSQYRVFEIALSCRDKVNFIREKGIFLLAGGNLKGSCFDHLNPFQS